MSKKNRQNEYNRIVEAIEGGKKHIQMPKRLLEEFGKGKKNLPKENTDELEAE